MITLDSPKVSICVASYNHARFLPATLDSILRQTYPHVEAVVVDDGSTDSSFEILEQYRREFPQRFHVFTHPNRANRGISATFNLATEKATGAYWSCLGSDDILYPDKIAEQVRFLDEHREIDWVYGFAHFIDDQGRRLVGLFGSDITRTDSAIETLILGNRIPGMTVLARRDCIQKVGPHDEDLIYSDWEFWIRLLAHHKAGFMARPLVQYRVHSTNTSVGVDRRENWKRGIAVLESIKEKSPSIGGDLSRPRIRALICFQLALHYFHLDNETAAAKYLQEVFEIAPTGQSQYEYLLSWLTPLGVRPSFFAFVRRRLPPTLAKNIRRKVSKRLGAAQFVSGARNASLALVPENIRSVLRRTRSRLVNR